MEFAWKLTKGMKLLVERSATQMEKVAYMLIVGDKEESGGSVSVRARSEKTAVRSL